MLASVVQNYLDRKDFKIHLLLMVLLMLAVFVNVFQDFLSSQRAGYAFYLEESLLFKINWFLYLPIIVFLFPAINNRRGNLIRVSIQNIGFATLIHILLVPFVGSFISFLFFNAHYGPLKFLFYTLEHDVISIFMVYTLFEIGSELYLKYSAIQVQNPPEQVLATLKVQVGKNHSVILVDNIYQISAATPYICIQLENKSYLHNETLKSFLERLDEFKFVRVHKTCIVNISKVVSFTSRLNGDYDLYLANGEIVRLSRTYAADFKMKMFNTPQLKQ